MSATLTIADDALVVTVDGADRLLTLHHTVSVPVAHVAGAELAGADPDALPHWYGKLAGTGTPGYLGGLFAHDGGTVFCDLHTHRIEATVVVTLRDETYGELVVTLADAAAAQAALAAVRAAVGS